MKVLVTGGSGFVGGRLAERLVRDGYQVKVLVRKTSQTDNLRKLGVELVTGDITNKESIEEAVSDTEKVFHIAALFRQAKHPDALYWKVNVEGTANIMEACLKYKVKRVIHCSTIGVLSHIETPPADETYPYNPGDIYQETKAEGEKLALRFHRERGLPVVVVRPAMIYGPGDLRLLKLFKSIARRRFIMLGSGRTLAHFVYIDDLINGFLLCAEKEGILGEIFIIAGGSPLTLNELTATIAQELKVKNLRLHFPVRPVQILGSLCEGICKPFGIEPPLYKRRVDFFTKDRSFNITKAQVKLDYLPKISMEEGIRRTIAWYRKERYL